jgi:hypothetical protein
MGPGTKQAEWEEGWSLTTQMGLSKPLYVNHFRHKDPFHAETEALQQAIKWYRIRRLHAPSDGTLIATNSRVLLQAITSGDQEDIPSWRAVPTVMKIIEDMRGSNRTIVVQYIDRKGVQATHQLANWARTREEHREGMQYEGIMGPNFNITIFDPGIFKRMQTLIITEAQT